MSSFLGSSGGSGSSPASSGSYGTIKLAGDLSTPADAPRVIDLSITGEQQGSVLYFNGTNWVQLPPSTSGFLLKTLGVGANPTWQDPAIYTNVDATNLITGGLRLTGDLSGSATSPTVVDLTITGETQGAIIYFNGTNWVKLDPDSFGKILQTNGTGQNPTWETVLNTGTALLDFGSIPGTNLVSTAVTGQTNITSTSVVKAFLNKNSTPSHNESEHQIIGLDLVLTTGDIVNGVGFTIYAYTELRLTGSFKINWEWR